MNDPLPLPQIPQQQDSLGQDSLGEARQTIQKSLDADGAALLPPMDVLLSLKLMQELGFGVQATIIDPWYNKGIGGVREDYKEYVLNVLSCAGTVSKHVFFWGFPEIVAPFVEAIPEPLHLVAWLTWYYKNNPSVIRGWRSSQNACLHLAHPEARLYPEHFLNDKQKQLQSQGKLRYMPGPTSVIEEVLPGTDDVIEQSLLVGFVGRKEQTGHPAQKPSPVFEKLFLMTTQAGDLVYDPMSGSGTTGVAARKLERRAIISDLSEDYTQMAERRLGIKRVHLSESLLNRH